MRSAVECRAGRVEEYPAAAALRQEMAIEMGSDFDARSKEWRAKFCAYFGGRQSAGNAQLFLALDGERPVGCAMISVSDDYRRFCFGTLSGHVNAVFVQPAYRRSGVATRLMQLVIAWARERGCARVLLRSSDEGRALYQELGFATGREMELYL